MNARTRLLEMQGISIAFSGIQVLFDVNLQLEAGEIHCLVGENGAGKSTLVKVLCGMNRGYTGSVAVDGVDIEMQGPHVSRQAGIFSVQQHRDLVPTMNAAENIFLGNYILGRGGAIDTRAMREKAAEYLRLFETEIDLDLPVSRLKVSEQEIVAICKAIASDGKIFLIDEASAPLDNFERTILYNLLRTLRDEGKGIIYISHHLEEIFAIGDRVTVLRNGRNVWTKRTDETDRADLIAAMTGNKKLYSRCEREHASPEPEPMIEFDRVSDGELREVSFRIGRGEVIGFAGLEGSGKQRVADLMFGLKRPNAGSIRYRGGPVSFSHPSRAIRSNIALIPTERKVQGLVPCRSVAENVAFAAVNKTRRPVVRRRWMSRITRQSVEDLSIKLASGSQLVEYLSGGNQQKVLLAKWMHTGMDLLLCVEPTEGVDVGARGDIYRIMRRMSEQGKTIVIFSSDIDELLTLCDRVYTMTQGAIHAEYDAAKVDKQHILSDILTKQSAEVMA